MTTDSDEVLAVVDNGVGLVTLNRPQAINSLNQNMVDALSVTLARWAHDDAVRAVVLSGAGERGLCAGGDVVVIYHSARADKLAARHFWRTEYLLNAQISRFPKPYVSLMNGIVMGGGVGVGAHANTRVVTDTSKVAMPEVGIGFIPDVGGAYLLSRAPGALGLHAALTGAPFSAADAIAMGFADHFVPQETLATFLEAIVTHGGRNIDQDLARYSIAPPPSNLAVQRHWIDECYAGQTVADIINALRHHGSEPARDAAELIAARSPLAASVTLQAVRRAAMLETLEEVLIQDYRVSCAALSSHDLVEGIRAQLIDKDRQPSWSPTTLADVSTADVAAYFAAVDDDLTVTEGELR